jgi:hypothetical protein
MSVVLRSYVAVVGEEKARGKGEIKRGRGQDSKL